MTLRQLAVGSRLIVRSKLDWRFASVAKYTDEKIVLTVCSPTGRTYRLRRELDDAVVIEGQIPILSVASSENWRTNFSTYDGRW